MGKLKLRFFASFFLIALIPLIFAGGSYIWGAKLVTQITNDSFRDRLTQTMREVERSIDGISELSDTLANTTWVRRIAFMQGTEIDYRQMNRYELGQNARELENYASMNKLVDSIAIVFNQKELILTNQGVDSYEWFFSRAYAVDGMTVDQWKEYLDSYSDTLLYPRTVRTYSTTDDYVTYIKTVRLPNTNVTMTPSSYEGQVGIVTLFIMIRESDIAQLLSTVAEQKGESAYIFDEDGNLVTSYHGDEDVLDQLAHSAGTPSPESFESGGRSMYAFTVTSERTGWRYVAASPSEYVSSHIYLMKYLSITFGVLLCAVVVAGVASWALSKRSYAPIKHIMDDINKWHCEPGDEEQAHNEYQYINRVLAEYYRNNSELMQKTDLYRPIVLHSLFVKLLYGFLDDDGAALLRSISEIPNPEQPWTTLVMLATDEDDSMFKTQISKLNVGESAMAIALPLERRKIAVVTNVHFRGELKEVAAAVAAAQGGSGGYLVGVGRHVPVLWDIALSFTQASQALIYASGVHGGESVFFFDDIVRAAWARARCPTGRRTSSPWFTGASRRRSPR